MKKDALVSPNDSFYAGKIKTIVVLWLCLECVPEGGTEQFIINVSISVFGVLPPSIGLRD